MEKNNLERQLELYSEKERNGSALFFSSMVSGIASCVYMGGALCAPRAEEGINYYLAAGLAWFLVSAVGIIAGENKHERNLWKRTEIEQQMRAVPHP